MIIRGPIEINLNTYKVKVHDEPLNLTPTEYNILVTLAQKPGRVFSRLQLLNSAMGKPLSIMNGPLIPMSAI